MILFRVSMMNYGIDQEASVKYFRRLKDARAEYEEYVADADGETSASIERVRPWDMSATGLLNQNVTVEKVIVEYENKC